MWRATPALLLTSMTRAWCSWSGHPVYTINSLRLGHYIFRRPIPSDPCCALWFEILPYDRHNRGDQDGVNHETKLSEGCKRKLKPGSYWDRLPLRINERSPFNTNKASIWYVHNWFLPTEPFGNVGLCCSKLPWGPSPILTLERPLLTHLCCFWLTCNSVRTFNIFSYAVPPPLFQQFRHKGIKPIQINSYR
jgi:hypothetical protein